MEANDPQHQSKLPPPPFPWPNSQQAKLNHEYYESLLTPAQREERQRQLVDLVNELSGRVPTASHVDVTPDRDFMAINSAAHLDRKRAIWRAGELWPHDMRAVIEFFSMPHLELDGATPDAVIKQGGIDLVMMLLDKIESELRH